MSPRTATRPAASEPHVPVPRRAAFDWEGVAVHWVPGDASTTHVINALHLFLPEGERWFLKVFKHALPEITDDLLMAQVRAFMSQEGQHATAHDTARHHLEDHGVGASAYLRRLDWLFGTALADHDLPAPLEPHWLRVRLGLIAGIEHYTAILGQWVLDQTALEEAGADPTMLDLLRWHGAEEVEHRSVAFDLFQHVSGSYPLRAVTGWVAFAGLMAVTVDGTRSMLRSDPDAPNTFVRAYANGQAKGRLPDLLGLGLAGLRYLRPGYHPSSEGDLEAAMAYIARSPSHLLAKAVRAKQRATRRARRG